MTLGWHNMIEAVERSWRTHTSSDGGLWIVGLDGLLLVPVLFAVFFYPKVMLLGIGAVMVLMLIAYEVVHFSRTHHAHWFWHR